MTEIEYSQETLDDLISLVKQANFSDDLPIYTWARAAKVLLAELEKREEKEGRE